MERNKTKNDTKLNIFLIFLLITILLYLLYQSFFSLEKTHKNVDFQRYKKVFINNKSLIYVIDGDTIKYKNITIRFLGIDAPEYKHKQKNYIIEKYNVKNISCLNLYGKIAREELIKLIKASSNITFLLDGKDKYGRQLGLVLINGSIDVNEILLKKGLAFTYDKSKFEKLQYYQFLLKESEKEKRGVFSCLN